MRGSDTAAGFAARLREIYTGSVLTKLIDVGHRTGLLEALAEGPATSAELASRVRLQERYVREWLGALASSAIADYDPATARYSLPDDHAATLTGPTARNLAPMSRWIEHFGTHLDELVACFHRGGGIPYSAFRPDFTEAMDDLWRRIYDEQLIDGFLPVAPELVRLLAEGSRFADIGCGTGHAVNLMARRYPRSQFVGYDLGTDAVARAAEEARSMGLTNARFEVLDVRSLPLDDPFDAVTAFDAVHDQVEPARVLRRIHDALRPDGVFYMVDFKFSSHVEENIANPFAPLYYGISLMHCMTVSLAEGGAGLGTVWGEQLACRMLREAGFATVSVHDSPRPQNCIYVCLR